MFYGAKLFFVVFQTKGQVAIETHPVFGKIKRPIIPDAATSAGLKFKLDTVEGEPITASETAKVIFLPPSSTRFGYREKIYLIAKSAGFNTDVTNYKFVGPEAVFEDEKQKISIDVSNFNFHYQYFFENTPEVFEKAISPDKNLIGDQATNFLTSIDRYPKELANGKTNSIFLSYNFQDKTVNKADINANANIVEIDFYRPDIDAYPTVSSTYFNSSNYVLLTYNGETYKVLRAQVRFFEKSEDQVGIYPIKTGKNAYENLINGKAYVISNPSSQTNITLKKMFLAYYDPDVYQEYLQPVYVFLGENNFVAYVPALTDEYLSE